MIYKCICGQEFDNPQKFNHHKLECKIHIESKVFDYNLYVNSIRQKQSTAAKANAEKRKIELQFKKQKKLDSWISAQHTCEKCGKIMTEKYGSGRFCSKSCANTRNHSSNTKCKISEKLKQTSSFFNKHIDEETHKKSSATLHKNKSMRYYQNPKDVKFAIMLYRMTFVIELLVLTNVLCRFQVVFVKGPLDHTNMAHITIFGVIVLTNWHLLFIV